jgi:CelD/BcsL family acetyltransferase involved in cellulose biosynthesis
VRLSPRASLGEYADQWDDLVRQLPIATPFLRTWWLNGLRNTRTVFVLVTDRRTLLGGLALEIATSGVLERIGFLGEALAPDHLDLLVRDGKEQEVYDALRAWFSREGSRLIDLKGVAETNSLTEVLPAPVHSTDMAIAPFTHLEGNYGDYLAKHVGGRKSMKDSLRRLRREAVLSYRLVQPELGTVALATLRQLHEDVWGTKSGFLPNFDAFTRSAVAGIHSGELRIHELLANDRVIASQVMFQFAGRTSHYQGGRDTDPRWSGSGTVLMAHVIEAAYREGLRELDCLRGDSDYKRHWATNQRQLLRLRAAHGRIASARLSAELRVERTRRRVGRLIRPLRRRIGGVRSGLTSRVH